MAAFVNARDTAVHPLAAWRVVGIARAGTGYRDAVGALPDGDNAALALVDTAHTEAAFLDVGGLDEPGLALSR